MNSLCAVNQVLFLLLGSAFKDDRWHFRLRRLKHIRVVKTCRSQHLIVFFHEFLLDKQRILLCSNAVHYQAVAHEPLFFLLLQLVG